MNSRKLTLRYETLADLTTDELGSVAGASGVPCMIDVDTRTVYCNTVVTYSLLLTGCQCTGMWPTLRFPCTGPIDTTGA